MRVRAKVDDNQKQIVASLRKCGYTVLHLHQLGKGAPDILVGARGINLLFEIKDGNKSPSRQKLTADEVDFHLMWKGQVNLVTSAEEAIKIISKSL